MSYGGLWSVIRTSCSNLSDSGETDFLCFYVQMLHLGVSATRVVVGSGLGGGVGSEGTRGTLNEAHELVLRTQNYSVFTNAALFKILESMNKPYNLKIISTYFLLMINFLY